MTRTKAEWDALICEAMQELARRKAAKNPPANDAVAKRRAYMRKWMAAKRAAERAKRKSAPKNSPPT